MCEKFVDFIDADGLAWYVNPRHVTCVGETTNRQATENQTTIWLAGDDEYIRVTETPRSVVARLCESED